MSEQNSLGAVDHENSSRSTDYLYRISIKCLIRNDKGEVLVVKEEERSWWDLPGGGMDHSETIKSAIAREMKEEVNLKGDFTYKIIDIEEPAYVQAHDFWQLRLIFEVDPVMREFSPGIDADQIAFMDPSAFENSEFKTEQRIYHYANIAWAAMGRG